MMQKALYILLSFYLVFNFFDRAISYYFLLILLFLSVYHLFKTKLLKNKFDVYIFSSAFLLSFYLIIFSVLYNTPFSSIDNYARTLLLFPIYIIFRDYKLNYHTASNLLRIITSFVCIAIIFDFFNLGFIAINLVEISSSKISIAGMLMIILLLILYDTLRLQTNNTNRVVNIILISILCLAISDLQVRGVFIGLIFALFPLLGYVFKYIKNNNMVIFSSCIILLTIMLMAINTSKERLSFIDDISLDHKNNKISYTKSFMNNISDTSVASRLYYLEFSAKKISENLFSGLGSEDFREALTAELANDHELKVKIDIHSHAHNEFADIAVKYGIIGLSLFILFIYSAYTSLKKGAFLDYTFLGIIVLYSSLGFMMTQATFSHSQPSTFFIVLLYLFIANCHKDNLTKNS